MIQFNSRCRTRIGRLVRAGKSDTSALVMPAASDPPARRRQPAPPLQRSSREPYLKFGLGTVSERNGCSGPQPWLSESARADGSVAGISYSNFPNELAPLCDSAGKSRAWRGLDAAFPSHFVMLMCLFSPAVPAGMPITDTSRMSCPSWQWHTSELEAVGLQFEGMAPL